MSASNDQALWRAVIAQALDDASRPLSKLTYMRLDQLRARDWFMKDNRDFEQVCALADMNADRVRKHALPLIERATQRDTTPGQGRNTSRSSADRPSPVSQDIR
jgi:hypothetical protein